MGLSGVGGLGMKGSQACVKCNVFVSLLFMHMLPLGGGATLLWICACVRVCILLLEARGPI